MRSVCPRPSSSFISKVPSSCALKGAQQTLLDCRPIVAATVYHNDDGIWRTADWLMKTLADYRFLFRNHSWCGTGAVIYAIPREGSVG